MIRSMTGYGAASFVGEGVAYTVEIRTVNNRYLKLSVKLPEHLQFVGPRVEKLLRERIVRGTVSYALRAAGDSEVVAGRINTAVLQAYADQIAEVRLRDDRPTTVDLGSLTMLPGVYQPPDLNEADQERHWEVVESLTREALAGLTAMRQEEGAVLRDDLLAHLGQLRTSLETINAKAPTVADEYHERLRARVALLMKEGGFELEAEGLMREVAIFAERCDISEEISRLGSHIDQFAELCQGDGQAGRKLDFIAQELLREVNTIGAKANDAAIARSVLDMKALIDRMKEQVQNAE